MTSDQRGRLTQLLSAFVDAHPGTRRGYLFGRPAMFAGAKPFAEITDVGLACRVSVPVARANRLGGRLVRSDRRAGWVIVSAACSWDAAAARVTALLELAAANVATGALQDQTRE